MTCTFEQQKQDQIRTSEGLAERAVECQTPRGPPWRRLLPGRSRDGPTLRTKRRVVVGLLDCRGGLLWREPSSNRSRIRSGLQRDWRSAQSSARRRGDLPGVGCFQDAAGIDPRCERSEESLPGRSPVKGIFPDVSRGGCHCEPRRPAHRCARCRLQ